MQPERGGSFGGQQQLAVDLPIQGIDEAIVGVSCRECDPVLVYNADTLVQKLMTGSGMTEDEAIEYAQFNIFDAYLGPQTPIFIEPV